MGMNRRTALTGIATGDQMIFLHRELFQAMGGYAAIPLMEDIQLCRELRRRAPPLIVDKPVITSSRRWEKNGILRTIITMWGMRLAYFLGMSPQRLHRYYYG